jgi:flagellar motility protein MotE (MotC chaperone)
VDSNAWADVLKTLIVAGLGISISTITPYLFKLRQEREEKGKLKAETSSITANAATTLIEAAGALQESYTKLLKDMKDRNEENRAYIDTLVTKLNNVERVNQELQVKAMEHTKLLEEAKLQDVIQQAKIDELIIGINLLQEQVKRLGDIPVYTLK